jgi:hypothetical protein
MPQIVNNSTSLLHLNLTPEKETRGKEVVAIKQRSLALWPFGSRGDNGELRDRAEITEEDEKLEQVADLRSSGVISVGPLPAKSKQAGGAAPAPESQRVATSVASVASSPEKP